MSPKENKYIVNYIQILYIHLNIYMVKYMAQFQCDRFLQKQSVLFCPL